MDKHSVLIRRFVCMICFFPLLWGCEKPSEPHLKTKQITTKIIIEKKDVQKATAKPKGTVPADISNSKQKSGAEKSTAPKKIKVAEISDVYNPEGKLDPFEPLFKKERVSRLPGRKKSNGVNPLHPLKG
jgi:hypothetical protein